MHKRDDEGKTLMILDLAILILLILNVVLAVLVLRAVWRTTDAVTDPALSEAVDTIVLRFTQLDHVLERLDRASVGQQLGAQSLAIDLAEDRRRVDRVADALAERQSDD